MDAALFSIFALPFFMTLVCALTVAASPRATSSALVVFPGRAFPSLRYTSWGLVYKVTCEAKHHVSAIGVSAVNIRRTH